MSFSAQDILDAFVIETGTRQSHVTFALRGHQHGYVRIYGPNAAPGKKGQPCVAVQRYNGAVIFNHQGVATLMNASLRPSAKNITAHPLGSGSGAPGKFGLMRWGLDPVHIAQKYRTAGDLVKAIINAFGNAGVPW